VKFEAFGFGENSPFLLIPLPTTKPKNQQNRQKKRNTDFNLVNIYSSLFLSLSLSKKKGILKEKLPEGRTLGSEKGETNKSRERGEPIDSLLVFCLSYAHIFEKKEKKNPFDFFLNLGASSLLSLLLRV